MIRILIRYVLILAVLSGGLWYALNELGLLGTADTIKLNRLNEDLQRMSESKTVLLEKSQENKSIYEDEVEKIIERDNDAYEWRLDKGVFKWRRK